MIELISQDPLNYIALLLTATAIGYGFLLFARCAVHMLLKRSE
ncbi:MAG: hypothetical protein ABIH21_05810 [Patescibacteria group bacterium]